MAVWRLSNELDFFKPRVGPSSTGVDGAGGGRERHRETERYTKGEIHVSLSLISYLTHAARVQQNLM